MSKTNCQNGLFIGGGVILVALLCGAPALADLATFQGLGDLAGGGFYSTASGVSADGSVVVGQSFSGSGLSGEAFRWTAEGGMVGLGGLAVIAGSRVHSFASDVSADGSVVVGTSIAWFGSGSLTLEAFRWTAGSGMVGLGGLYGLIESRASGVSADGSVVVGTSRSASAYYDGFRWTQSSGMVGLGGLAEGGVYSWPQAVSADGLVVVGYGDSASGTQALRWTASTGTVGLGDLHGGTYHSTALAVSADGSVVVGQSNSALGWEAFRWTADDRMVGLGFPVGGSLGSGAWGVSADGSVVVGDGGDGAMIWDETNGMRSLQGVLTVDYGLDLTGWQLFHASGISADGLTIVGNGTNPDGQYEAWIAHLGDPVASPVPIPGAALLGVLGLGVAGWRLRRQGA